MTLVSFSKKVGHIFVLNMMASFIHSGATLSKVPRDKTRYRISVSPASLLAHVRLNE